MIEYSMMRCVDMITKTKLGNFDLIIVERENIIIELMNYGATIYSLKTPDKNGIFEDIVLQYENPEDYLNNSIYLNSTTGPIAGRIKNGILEVNNEIYRLNKNDHGNTLHSGDLALSFKTFDFDYNEGIDYDEVNFFYQEKQLIDYGLVVSYKIYDSKVEIEYQAKPKKDFIFSLTNHGYFNLSGNLKSDIKNHLVKLNTNLRHDIDDFLVNNNRIIQEEGVYNFTNKKRIGSTIFELEEDPKMGVDDIFFYPQNSLDSPMAIVEEEISGRRMKVYSTMDHLVFYTHNNVNNLGLKHLDGHKKHYALCFEAQKAPYGFSDNRTQKIIIEKNQVFKEKIIFEFI